MVKEGYWYGLPVALAALGSFALGLRWAAAAFLILTALILNFFRDPERALPPNPLALVSPADGRVVQIAYESLLGRPVRRVSIFMSPLDVHVNRSPFAGTLRAVEYKRGSFRVASGAKASAENEQNVLTLDTAAGSIVVKQIAGLLARRIVCWKRVGDRLQRGERVGLIKFGSRVDVLLDPGIELSVKVGDRVRAGSSVLAVSLPGESEPLSTLGAGDHR
ncbi:MAG TPA: phosphatidylserine decarboxylase [Terriglobia bacterium]|nr:phosphatidylserine decarboxylase [Terriglobia bacterium]